MVTDKLTKIISDALARAEESGEIEEFAKLGAYDFGVTIDGEPVFVRVEEG